MIMVDKLAKTVARDPHTRFVGSRSGHRWCHMWAEHGEEEQLHEFAAKIGLKRTWYQPHRIIGHYDLVPSKRALAIAAGAVETDLKDWLKRRTK